jgi:signal transduction histidine kinase
MALPGILNRVKYLLMLAVMVFTWSVLAMVYTEHFIQPFHRLIPWLMPWKGLYTIPVEAGMEERLSIMQRLLDASGRVSDISFFVMIISFTLFSVYLTLIYQQKQRKSHENRLLLLKNQEIARRNEFIRYISATISHEFKNNLGRIKRRIDLLSDLPGEAKARIDDNMDKLFADIDIFKKISDEREGGMITFEKINLKDMLAHLSEQYTDFAEIVFRGDTLPPVIFASKALVKTVFENIIDNAIKYKKPEQNLARISISSSFDIDGTRPYVSLLIRDEGRGMDEQQADQCFYKGKASQTGWGEGLYFAKYVIGLHAGKIRVGKEYTAPGVGTEIIINLPFVEETLHV